MSFVLPYQDLGPVGGILTFTWLWDYTDCMERKSQCRCGMTMTDNDVDPCVSSFLILGHNWNRLPVKNHVFGRPNGKNLSYSHIMSWQRCQMFVIWCCQVQYNSSSQTETIKHIKTHNRIFGPYNILYAFRCYPSVLVNSMSPLCLMICRCIQSNLCARLFISQGNLSYCTTTFKVSAWGGYLHKCEACCGCMHTSDCVCLCMNKRCTCMCVCVCVWEGADCFPGSLK